MGIVRKHLAFEELTPTLLREMVEKIVVHECSYDEMCIRDRYFRSEVMEMCHREGLYQIDLLNGSRRCV